MAENLSVIIAAFINAVMRISLFIKPNSECSATAPNFASFLFMAALCMLILDNKVFPDRYRHVGRSIIVLCEIIVVLLLLEIGLNVVWCQMERIIESAIRFTFIANRLNLYADMGGDVFTGIIISVVAFFFFMNVAIMTEWTSYTKSNFLNVIRSRAMRNVIDFCGKNGSRCGVVEEHAVKLENTMKSHEPAYMEAEVSCNHKDEPIDFSEEPEPDPQPPTRKRQRRKIISLMCTIQDWCILV